MKVLLKHAGVKSKKIYQNDMKSISKTAIENSLKESTVIEMYSRSELKNERKRY